MSNAIRGLAIVLIAALAGLAMPFGGASAVALPFYQKSANIEQISRNGNIHQVADARRRIYLRDRQARFRPGTPGYYPRARYVRDRSWHSRNPRDRYWRYRNPRDRYWRYRQGRFHDWPRYRNRFYHSPYWGVDPWWDYDPPVIVAPPVSYDSSAHIEWCLAHYRSYNPRTNTWVGYSGQIYQCDSPYE
jgi:hypothetical protein